MKKRNALIVILLFTMIISIIGCGSSAGGHADVAPLATQKPYTTQAPVSDSSKYNQPAPTQALNGSVNYSAEVANDMYMTSESYYDEYILAFNTEEYTSVDESSYSKSLTSPLSTFAADVDTASYANFRRMVNSGYSLKNIPSGSIRTEEMVNYFKYNYAKPEGNDPFAVTTVVSDCPWNSDVKLMSIGITTNEMDSKDIPSSNIVFLIDVSGSMYEELPLIKDSMELLLEKFDKDDRISIVTYASGTQVVLSGAKGNEKSKIIKAFNGLRASGATYGSGGIELAYKAAEENFIEGGVNRVIICSDGDFNVGLSSQSELEKLITEKKDSGIFLSVLGFGMGNYSDTIMETLADCGNGNYGYIDNITEAKKILIDEMTSTFVTVAKDVKFQVEFNPARVEGYRLVGYENRALAAEDFTDDTKDGGEMGAGHQVTALYEIMLTDGVYGDSGLKYQTSGLTNKGVYGDEYCTLSIAYKAPDGDTSSYLEFPIGIDNYTKNPSEDFRFAACVAEASLALRNSPYLVAATQQEALTYVISEIGRLNSLSSYQEEFLQLLENINR